MSLVSISPRRRVLRAKKFALLGLMVDASVTIFALQAKKYPKLAFYGVPGEFCTGCADEGPVLGELCPGPCIEGLLLPICPWICGTTRCCPTISCYLADMFLGLRHAQMRPLDVGLVLAPRSRVRLPLEARVGASFRCPSTAFPQDSSHFAENVAHPYI